ncbi:hypothetical protein A3C23_00775 [Candidatus Roizmanbacteria bacterium RIFCSPHIGHO2_02_FULL_37_13b]|uniref:Glycosyltransferase RgtA/B/C/D-like domain-containing protein n=1 Tax=Candidatus Roizmanbacteria bacterium RIFCSPLOWO2_02_FULL_36_11 TaxID=1802071 RepID=A0A1F7JD53_9BACT|nr:MAG: hypothetical protein A3C23_00775 [Candidatus Roizmanbacteria bacterium RIFCSPHIGHO2_02_FULL_37_13b]OGK53531.1 MAG: hypothetical protein A3H78_04885 [Candidatus Roizmanbacteria bacterium RIFCSPLOWO2_02_FULL_36_11]
MSNIRAFLIKYKNILDLNELIIIFCISIVVVILSFSHVLYGLAQTPKGSIYLFNGHYYLDYFYYLAFVAQGIFGKLIAIQVFATDDFSIYPHLWPYILIGNLGRLFFLDVIKSYWFANMGFIALIVFQTFFVIKKLFKHDKFSFHMLALLLTIFASPLFIFLNFKPTTNIRIWEYWYSYGNFFHRFETVPHHLLSYILVVLAISLIDRLIFSIEKYTFKKIVLKTIIVSIVLLAGFSINPFFTALITGVIILTLIIYSAFYFRQQHLLGNKLFLTAILLTILFACGAYIYQHFYLTNAIFLKNFKATESNYHQFVDFKTWILNIGIICFFIPFGIKSFFREIKPIKIILLLTVLFSTIIYFTRIDSLFGTHNGRFISPINYLLYGSLAIMGIKEISKRLIKPGFSFVLIITFVLLSFIPPNIVFFKSMINDKNIMSPISYLPEGILKGYNYLNTFEDDKVVLTTPSQFLGQVLPAFVNKKVYIARYIATPNFLEKSYGVDWFYLGKMTKKEAINFLNKNNIGYIVLTSIEGYVKEPFLKYPFKEKIYKNYPFLERIYLNNDIVIFKVV